MLGLSGVEVHEETEGQQAKATLSGGAKNGARGTMARAVGAVIRVT